MFKTQNIRNTTISNLDKSVFIYLNSESKGIVGSNNNFNFDINNLPLDKNKQYNLFVKNVYFPANSPQITDLYNYNKMNIQIINRNTQAVVATQLITIRQGTYSSAQLIFEFARIFNSYLTNVAVSYGGDNYEFTYDDILNRILIRRLTLTPVGGVNFDVRLLSNDANSIYNGEPGFGLGFVMGMPYNSFFNLPLSNITNNIFELPNPVNLTPYLYYYLLLEGINNLNTASDLPSVNNIIFKCPLIVASGRYSYVYIDEANPDFGQLFVSTLPSRLNIKVVDQYGNLFPLAENSAIDLTLKLTPTE
jgi:hypothetical protein